MEAKLEKLLDEERNKIKQDINKKYKNDITSYQEIVDQLEAEKKKVEVLKKSID